MKLSIFTTQTNSDHRGDNAADALECYTELADETVIVEGGFPIYHNGNLTQDGDKEHPEFLMYHWPKEFSWEFIGQQFTRGYEACTGDWVIHADIDFLFHESDFGKIRQALRDYPNAPAVSFYKWQFILPDRFNLKSRLMIAVNKKMYGDRITFSGSGDLCQPQLDGKDLSLNEMPQAGVPFYNYEKLTKTKDQIIDDVERMDRAYQRKFNRPLYSSDDRTAYEGWYKMVSGRFNKPSQKIKLSQHPKYIQETIKNLTPEQFGYNGFGLIDGRVYA